MSFQAVAWAIEVRVGDPILKNLLMAICHHADRETWSCWPSQDLLAFETEVSKRTIQRKLEELQERGFLRIEKRRNDDGTQASSRLTVTGGQPVTLHPPVDKPSLSGGQKAGSPGDTTCPPVKKQEEQLEQKKDGAEAPLLFEEASGREPPDARVYRRGREILGPKAGGVIRNLIKSKNGVLGEAMAVLEKAADRGVGAMEFVQGAIRWEEKRHRPTHGGDQVIWRDNLV